MKKLILTAADAFATAMTNACKVLMNQLGTSGN